MLVVALVADVDADVVQDRGELEPFALAVGEPVHDARLVEELRREPGDLLRVQVRPLWEDNYRVNVLVGVNAASARVANSYFVVTDGDGNVLESTPQVRRLY